MTKYLRKYSGVLISFALVGLFGIRPAFGHFLWVSQQSDGYFVARGQMPDKLEPYDPPAVKLIKAYDREGVQIEVSRIDEKERVFFNASASLCLVAVQCDWGGRVNTTRGKKLMLRREAEQQGFKVLESFFSTQTSKTLFEDSAAACAPLGMKFELVPVKSPALLEPGEPLEVKLIFDGAPLKHAGVSSGDNIETETDERGVAKVSAPSKGWNVVTARHIVRTSYDPDVDYHQFMTFLVFKGKG